MSFNELKLDCPANRTGDTEGKYECNLKAYAMIGIRHILHSVCTEDSCPVLYWIRRTPHDKGHS